MFLIKELKMKLSVATQSNKLKDLIKTLAGICMGVAFPLVYVDSMYAKIQCSLG